MGSTLSHRGIAAEDQRNAGPIAYFRPKPVTPLSMRATLAPYYSNKSAAELEKKIEAVMRRIARGPIRPDPPLSQPLDAVADPVYGLGTHPDIIDEMWKLDDGLPQRCRWVFWGGPALVHPQTGIVFAVGMGTLGLVMRLPQTVLEAADPESASVSIKGNVGTRFKIAGAGPEWRFIRSATPQSQWARAAYEFAGETMS